MSACEIDLWTGGSDVIPPGWRRERGGPRTCGCAEPEHWHQRVLTRQGQSTQIGCVKYAATGEAAGEPAVLLPSMRCGRASLLTPDHPPKGLARLAPLAS